MQAGRLRTARPCSSRWRSAFGRSRRKAPVIRRRPQDAAARCTSAARGASAEELQAELQALTWRDALVAGNEALVANAMLWRRNAMHSPQNVTPERLVASLRASSATSANVPRVKSSGSNRAQCDLLDNLLHVLDNLERALDAAEHLKGKVLEGVQLTRRCSSIC